METSKGDNRMRYAYRIILIPEEKGYTVYIPDFDIGTQGADIADAMYMARDVISVTGVTLEDIGKKIPVPGEKEYSLKAGEMDMYVDVDFMEYKKKHDNRKVKKTLTIPSRLNEAAENENINFSRTLEEALLNKLSI